MAAPQDAPGFPPRVWDQLQQTSHQLAQQHRGNHRGRGQGRGMSSMPQPSQNQYLVQNQTAPFQSQQLPPSSMSNEAFPPLGASRPLAPSNMPPQPQYQQPAYHQAFNTVRQVTPREYQDRARGNYRGNAGHFRPQQTHYPVAPMAPMAPAAESYQHHAYGRPPPRHARLFNPNSSMGYGTVEQQRNLRHVRIKQSDYLNSVGRKACPEHRLSREESLEKESFRLELEEVARNALKSKYPDLDIKQVQLKCYGSLGNGFALGGCDMDLLLALPKWSKEMKSIAAVGGTNPEQDLTTDDEDDERAFNMEVRRVLEKAYLDQGYGARLLTNTRVPILRICQSPNAELLQNLRDNRAAWEKSSYETPAPTVDSSAPNLTDSPPDVETVEQSLADLTVASTVPRAPSPRGNTGLEFTADCGIQCDINFTNFVALYNTALLKLYHDFDKRVGELGVFVKIWAKMRDINTPYRGTLSSYGYIMMVLHYLMNVASPPVIPNLQHLATCQDDWFPDLKVKLIEGCDIRYLCDPRSIAEVRQEMASNPNRETPGQLLRGFFQYYATREGFHWTRDVISIRRKGGIVSKQEKGWTEAKWVQKGDNHVRLRYLLAIEDPFEVDHNIARTVGHHGLVAIRDEFRRAWSIIERVGAGEDVSVDEFLEPVTDRADTLKKDLEFHRQKQKELKAALEAKEKALLDQAKTPSAEEALDGQIDGTLGNSDQGKVQSCSSGRSSRQSSSSKLTSTTSCQDNPTHQPRKNWRYRKVIADSEGSEDEGSGGDVNGDMSEASKLCNDKSAASEPDPETPRPTEHLCSPEDVLLAQGLDIDGNPVAWDVDTQDGRWLHWRDCKIRQGKQLHFAQPSLRKLHEQCPFHPDRPNPYLGKPYKDRFELMRMNHPPWPANVSEHEPSRIGLAQKESAESMSTPIPAEASLSHGETTSPGTTSTNCQSEPAGRNVVGEFIQWDTTTRGGDFLRFRDRRLRQGRWVHRQRSQYTEIDRAFPYNPEMTHDELEKKNEILRMFYTFTLHRCKVADRAEVKDTAKESQGTGSDAQASVLNVVQAADTSSRDATTPTTVSSRDPPIEDKTASQRPQSSLPPLQTVLTHNIDILKEVSTASRGHGALESRANMPATPTPGQPGELDAKFIRAQRLAFFAQQAAASSAGDGETNSRIFYPSVKDDPERVFVGSPKSHTPAYPMNHGENPYPSEEASAAASSGMFNKPSYGHGQGVENAEPARLGNSLPQYNGSDSVQLRILNPASLKIPGTLCPSLDSNEHPRDEDRQVMPMPISQTLGFPFDARQLRDLAVIAQGGNGCARDGAEFTIDPDYEPGGGGVMGRRTSTGPKEADGPEQTGEDGDTDSFHTGRGDVKGLLGELPGDVASSA
ncbi:Terminal uridylyltransferase cid1 [Exophiala dermatitidis]